MPQPTHQNAALMEALPCPFCGDVDIRYYGYNNEPQDHYMQCHGCTTTGPFGTDKQAAIAAWNRRTAPAPQAEEADLPTGDQLRAIAKSADNMSGPSNRTQATEYVLAGWKAALAARADLERRNEELLAAIQRFVTICEEEADAAAKKYDETKEPYFDGRRDAAEALFSTAERYLAPEARAELTGSVLDECLSSHGPEGCYRVRCQLGKTCADAAMKESTK